jgi:hypothetical protein
MLTAVTLCLVPALFVNQPPATVKDTDLHNSYTLDALDADIRYKDKPVTVRGSVLKVLAEGGRCTVLLTVALGSGQQPLPGVACAVAKGSESEFRNLKPNDKVTLSGTCRGARKDSTAYKGVMVTLGDCRRAK